MERWSSFARAMTDLPPSTWRSRPEIGRPFSPRTSKTVRRSQSTSGRAKSRAVEWLRCSRWIDLNHALRSFGYHQHRTGDDRGDGGVIAALPQAQDVGDQRVALLGAEREVGHERVPCGEVAVERARRRARPGGDVAKARRVVGGSAL